MRIIQSVHAFQRWRRKQANEKGLIGFVPTMGAFHAGHQSLMKRARRSTQTVVVSIFVNPLQFAPTEDLDQYPRPREADLALCRKMGVDVVVLPSQKEWYPADFQTSVVVSQLSKQWEGAKRRTHFQGVTTVVEKLLNLVKPHQAFFGQKDYQQCRIIQQMVEDLNQDIKIVMCPTIRESDGLAMSSRNTYLSQAKRQQALVLYQALSAGKKAIKDGEQSVPKIEKIMHRSLKNHSGITVDYLAVCHSETLEPLKKAQGKLVLLGAVRIGSVRLIDNLTVKASASPIKSS